MEHEGSLISGEVRCSCGWKSGHYALSSDAIDEWTKHKEDSDEVLES
jgi:hypothetical protein